MIHPIKTDAEKSVVAEIKSNVKEYTKEELKSLAVTYANKYGVQPSHVINLVNCENMTWDPKRQSDIVKNGIREDSWGLAQIYLIANTNITKKQAQDPDFSLDFMAKNLKEGRYRMWKTCSIKYGYIH